MRNIKSNFSRDMAYKTYLTFIVHSSELNLLFMLLFVTSNVNFEIHKTKLVKTQIKNINKIKEIKRRILC